jgi:hypothetical protein
MKRYVVESWLILLRLEFVMRVRGFKALHEIVRRQPVITTRSPNSPSSELLCRAIDYACVLYFKHVLCLQRSSATALLLRRHGWNAQLVIGAQIAPFKSHAWVEIGGTVANDKPYVLDIYQVLERC